MNGGGAGGGGMDSQTGILGSFGGGVSHWEFTAIISDVTEVPSADQNSGSSLDSLADPPHHSDISIDQSGPDQSSLSSGPDQSLSSSVSGSSHSVAQEGAADSPDATGNGRQTLLTNTNAGKRLLIISLFLLLTGALTQ
ncbi:putative lysozyme-like protein [Anoplopoma fimbria]|uniref:putative lysozyme-like protein n=1 Tax=Anoplopoma fimbria TaxID=229290 RepID=UPI0023EBE4E9|nr:putative lysozyme-like protein [Anoplopoma fimbria]